MSDTPLSPIESIGRCRGAMEPFIKDGELTRVTKWNQAIVKETITSAKHIIENAIFNLKSTLQQLMRQ